MKNLCGWLRTLFFELPPFLDIFENPLCFVRKKIKTCTQWSRPFNYVVTAHNHRLTRPANCTFNIKVYFVVCRWHHWKFPAVVRRLPFRFERRCVYFSYFKLTTNGISTYLSSYSSEICFMEDSWLHFKV